MKTMLCCAAGMIAVTCSAVDPGQGDRVPAFPGAEGAGAYARGGRGGAVYRVTNLNAAGPGSLAEAVSQPDRTVVFDVSGTIDLNPGRPGKAGRIMVKQPRITIAGQTAPGDGICLKNGSLQVTSEDVIVRHLRVRPGDELKAETDAISVGAGARNVIIDHCSASWSIDEVLSVSGAPISNVTVQWCIISESLNRSAHAKGEHGYGSLIRADGEVTYHHNLYAHHNSRNPRPGSYGEGEGLLLDFRNNIIYNWGSRAGYSSEDPARLNYAGNYLKAGSSSRRQGEAFNIGGPATRMFVSGNLYEGRDDLNADNWKMIGNFSDVNRRSQAYATAPVATDDAKQAFEKVLDLAGATLPKRDAVDARVVSEVRQGGGRIIDSQTDVGNWPELRSSLAAPDSDGDGMPDDWERKQKLDPANSEDGRALAANRYTNLENFLNAAASGETTNK